MAATVKTKIKVAVGVVCFIVIMAIVSIIVAVAIAGMTRPTLYDKKFGSIVGATKSEFIMIDGVFAANYNGDWVLTDGNNIVSKKYRELSYWKENLFLARLSKSEFAVVDTSGREVRAFNYSDRPLMEIDDEIYPYYIVDNGQQSTIKSINDSEVAITYDKIHAIGDFGIIESGSEVYGQKGYFSYEQEGKKYLTSVANTDLKFEIGQNRALRFHQACIEAVNYNSQTVQFYSLDSFTLLGEGTKFDGGMFANQSYLLTVDGYMVSAVTDDNTIEITIPTLNLNFSFAVNLPTISPVEIVFVQDSGVKVVVYNGTNRFLYDAKTGSMTAIGEPKIITLAGNDFVTFKQGDSTRIIAYKGEGDILGEYIKVKSTKGDLYREYVVSGSNLFKYDENLVAKLDFVRVTDKFVSSDGYFINCTDGTYDYRFNNLNSFVGNTTLVDKHTSCYIDKDGNKTFTDLGTQKTAKFDKDTFVEATSRDYGDDKYIIFFIVYDTDTHDNITNILDFNLKPMIDLSDTKLTTTPLSTLKYIMFFDNGEYAIVFEDKEMYMSYSGEFFEYGKYTTSNDYIAINVDGSVIAVMSGNELIIYRASMGRFKKKSQTYFSGGVSVRATEQNKLIFKDLQLDKEGLIDEYGNISVSAQYSKVLVSDKSIATIEDQNVSILSPNGRVLHEGIAVSVPYFINDYLVYDNELGFTVMVSPDGKVVSDKITSILIGRQHKWVQEDELISVIDKKDYDYKYYALTIGANMQIMKFPKYIIKA